MRTSGKLLAHEAHGVVAGCVIHEHKLQAVGRVVEGKERLEARLEVLEAVVVQHHHTDSW